MSIFSDEQGRTRVYDEAYCSYVKKVNLRRTQLVGKKAISGWKLIVLRNREKQHKWLKKVCITNRFFDSRFKISSFYIPLVQSHKLKPEVVTLYSTEVGFKKSRI